MSRALLLLLAILSTMGLGTSLQAQSQEYVRINGERRPVVRFAGHSSMGAGHSTAGNRKLVTQPNLLPSYFAMPWPQPAKLRSPGYRFIRELVPPGKDAKNSETASDPDLDGLAQEERIPLDSVVTPAWPNPPELPDSAPLAFPIPRTNLEVDAEVVTSVEAAVEQPLSLFEDFYRVRELSAPPASAQSSELK